jgi:hypothetical protein
MYFAVDVGVAIKDDLQVCVACSDVGRTPPDNRHSRTNVGNAAVFVPS